MKWGLKYNMKTRILGKDLNVSSIGLGCMGFSHCYGEPMSEKDAIRAIWRAADMGYTFFDTAEAYTGTRSDGSVSINEKLIRKALAPLKGKVHIATKFGVFLNGRQIVCDSSPENVRRSVEDSLRKLGVEQIDLYYQHRIDKNIPAEEVAGVMADLIKEGKIARWGISEADEEYLRRAHAVCPVTAVQNRYSMMYRDYEKLFPVLEELNIGFVAFSPLANGLLTDHYNNECVFDIKSDYRAAMPQFQKSAYGQNQDLLNLLRTTAEKYNASPAQISLAWMLNKKPYIVPIPGTRKMERMKENAVASDITLTSEEVAEIDAALDNMTTSDIFGGHNY